MWSIKRRIMYGLTTFIFVSALAVLILRPYFIKDPTCFDGVKNGFEVNVDCGGTCNLMCKEEVKSLTVIWAKAVLASKGMYDIVALVTNNNIDNSAKEIGYTFTLYDEQGSVIKKIAGSTISPLDGKFPIIIQNLPLIKAPVSVIATLTDGQHYKVLESPTSPTIKVLARKYEAGSIPRVYATIANTKHVEIYNLPVSVLLFDNDDNVYAVGKTIVPFLEKEGVKEVVFTWGQPLPFPPTRINIYPIFNPFDAKGN